MKPANFNIIRYANCWEDSDILLEGLDLKPGNKILSISSAGDNSLALLASGSSAVYAVDLSLPQLYLTELKQCAFAYLDYPEVLRLLGVNEQGKTSVNIYHHIAPKLSNTAKKFWTANLQLIEAGLIYAGKFEQYFKKFRRYFLPLVHNKTAIDKLLEPKLPEEQIAYYNSSWNTWRWKLLMSLFFSEYVMGKYGRAPQFLEHVKLSVPDYIKMKAEEHLCSVDCAANYFLHMIFTGGFGPTLPYYLREENFEAIKKNVHKLTLHHISADEAVKQRAFDVYNFSNIFEYMSGEAFDLLSTEWASYIPKGGKLAFWNLMNSRCFSEAQPGQFRYNPECTNLSAKDRGFFYSRFLLEEKL